MWTFLVLRLYCPLLETLRIWHSSTKKLICSISCGLLPSNVSIQKNISTSKLLVQSLEGSSLQPLTTRRTFVFMVGLLMSQNPSWVIESINWGNDDINLNIIIILATPLVILLVSFYISQCWTWSSEYELCITWTSSSFLSRHG